LKRFAEQTHMNYEVLEKLIEEIVLDSLGEQIRRLPSNERKIFSLYLDGKTIPQIVSQLEGACSLTLVTKTIAKIKEQLKIRYNAQVASRRI
jgi:Mg/Co/Ni transporter MgtE